MNALLALHDIQFEWRPGRPVIDISELEVQAGESVFLRGPSGSGKSTLLALIGGVAIPQRGSISILGTALSTLTGTRRDRFRADHIGFIFQQFNLLPYLDAVENILLATAFSSRRRERSGDACSEAQRLLERLQLDPQQLRGRPAGELSVGQQQRVAVARALIGSPELVVADEPTSALDADARDAFVSLLFAECARAHSALLLVSHERALEARFDRSIELTRINRMRSPDAA